MQVNIIKKLLNAPQAITVSQDQAPTELGQLPRPCFY